MFLNYKRELSNLARNIIEFIICALIELSILIRLYNIKHIRGEKYKNET